VIKLLILLYGMDMHWLELLGVDYREVVCSELFKHGVADDYVEDFAHVYTITSG